MKCIYCDKKAEYVMDGVSVCLRHAECISTWNIPSLKNFKESPLFKKSYGGSE